MVREIVNIYKEVAKPDAKGLTKTDFRNLFIKNNPTDRRKKDRRLALQSYDGVHVNVHAYLHTFIRVYT